MRKPASSIFALVLTLVVFIVILIINFSMAMRYHNADGKTRALFGIVELSEFSYKYYLLIPAVISVIFGVASITKKGDKRRAIIVLTISFISIILILLPFWRIFI